MDCEDIKELLCMPLGYCSLLSVIVIATDCASTHCSGVNRTCPQSQNPAYPPPRPLTLAASGIHIPVMSADSPSTATPCPALFRVRGQHHDFSAMLRRVACCPPSAVLWAHVVAFLGGNSWPKVSRVFTAPSWVEAHLPCPSTELTVGGPRTFPQALVHERSCTCRPLYCADLILEEDSRVEISRGPAQHGRQLPTDFTSGFLACH